MAAAVKTNHVVIFLWVFIFTFSLMILGAKAKGLNCSKIEGEELELFPKRVLGHGILRKLEGEELKLTVKKTVLGCPLAFPNKYKRHHVVIGSMTYKFYPNDEVAQEWVRDINCKKTIARMLLKEKQGIPVRGEALQIGKNQYQPICFEEEQHQRLLLKENEEAYVKLYLKNVINPIELRKFNITY
ncbi:hypothetical protein FRX31_027403 [Thalictrum thalictroides]|uniref:Uncharacterized protein n=1 Tax=Thalictrum thalictroides TaxID=46969 RepID=A0A7J6VDN3_THATH|nr:hypothetical protein FRX31_027403 [Thalictrum thalictroides]